MMEFIVNCLDFGYIIVLIIEILVGVVVGEGLVVFLVRV